jgi:hypothetical protein
MTQVLNSYFIPTRNAYETLAHSIPQALSIANPLNLPISDSASSGIYSNDVPVLRSDFPLVKFWYKRDWVSSQKDAKGISHLSQRGPAVRGKVRAAQGENVSMLYVEDEQGNVINGHRATDIRRVARSIWVQLAGAGKAPKTWGKADILTIDHYKKEMRRHFTVLRLCDQDWKADQIAIDNYPSWHQNYYKDAVKHEDSDANLGTISPDTNKRPQFIQPINSVKRKKLDSMSSTEVATSSDDISSQPMDVDIEIAQTVENMDTHAIVNPSKLKVRTCHLT